MNNICNVFLITPILKIKNMFGCFCKSKRTLLEYTRLVYKLGLQHSLTFDRRLK